MDLDSYWNYLVELLGFALKSGLLFFSRFVNFYSIPFVELSSTVGMPGQPHLGACFAVHCYALLSISFPLHQCTKLQNASEAQGGLVETDCWVLLQRL